jgi:rhodanese-related sulfurtransferase
VEYTEKGFKNVKVLSGGVEAWKQAGYPVEDAA